MTREWTLQRDTAAEGRIFGTFTTDDGIACAALERAAVAIPAGLRVRVALTVSGRATRGELWAPYDDHRLPELQGVPGRTAIRIHALNQAAESDGCIGTGLDHTSTLLEQSRPTVTRLVNELRTAETVGDEVWLTIRPAAG